MTLETCRGRRDLKGSLLGICILCDRRTATPKKGERATAIEPPAVRGPTGVWDCERMLAPAGWGGFTKQETLA